MIPARPLGMSGLRVPALGFGAGPLGDDALGDDEALALLHQAVDLGLGLVDTAPSYGHSEARIGRMLREREGVLVSTKLGYGIPGVEDWTGPAITHGIDRALTRLGVEALDLAHLHSCPVEVLQRGDVVGALLLGVEQGKVRVAGYSGEGEALVWAVRSGAFGVVQASVSCCDPVAGRSTLREAVARGIGVIAKRPLANAPWRGRAAPDTPEATYEARWSALALEVELPPAELMIRWAAYHPAVHVTIVGTVVERHLQANARAVARGPLPRDVQAIVDTAVTRASAEWPGVI